MQAVSKLTHLIWGQKKELYSLVKVESEKKGDSIEETIATHEENSNIWQRVLLSWHEARLSSAFS